MDTCIKGLHVAVKKPEERKKLPVRFDLLTAEEKAALREEAKKSLLAEQSQDARDAYFAKEMAQLRRAEVPADQIVPVMIDAAPFISNIMIDGIQFFHGYTYDVPVKQAQVLYEQMQRSWHHQDEIDGRSRLEAYRRPNNTVLGPQHAGTPTRGANGVVVAEL
jgi:hypothetical protein